ncbi:MAG: FHA domain-containing protein [Anaerolineae bacterium]|nr:FHA domain-containing protein [Anaerolineae bacterium]
MNDLSVPHLIDLLGEVFSLTAPTFTLGRAPDCDLIIADRRVSRRHAEIYRQEEGFILRDLDSTNGTWLNGQRLSAPALLQDGDIIAIGDVRFTFRDPDATLETSHFPRLVVDGAAVHPDVTAGLVHHQAGQRRRADGHLPGGGCPPRHGLRWGAAVGGQPRR